MTEEMLLLMLRKGRKAHWEVTLGCPFCDLAILRKLRAGDWLLPEDWSPTKYKQCDYCEWHSLDDCISQGINRLAELEEKFKDSEWAQ